MTVVDAAVTVRKQQKQQQQRSFLFDRAVANLLIQAISAVDRDQRCLQRSGHQHAAVFVIDSRVSSGASLIQTATTATTVATTHLVTAAIKCVDSMQQQRCCICSISHLANDRRSSKKGASSCSSNGKRKCICSGISKGGSNNSNCGRRCRDSNKKSKRLALLLIL